MGKKLKAALKRAAMTQAELAQHAGVSKQMMSFIVQGLRTPSATTLKRMSEALGCTMEDLL